METLARFGERFRSQESNDFENLVEEADDGQDSYVKHPAHRSHTDVPFLVGHGVFLLILAFLLGYCMYHGDIDRVTKGYDNCGNICGKNNNFVIDHQRVCKVQDMTHKPYLHIDDTGRKCVEKCEGNTILIDHQCLTGDSLRLRLSQNENQKIESFLIGLSKNLYLCLYEVINLCVISLAISLVILLMLRYATFVFVWFCVIGVLLASIGATAYFGYLAHETGYDYLLRLTVFCAVGTIVMLILVVVVAMRISLVVRLLKETEKSVSIMPSLLFEPILTFLALLTVWTAWFYFTLWIESAGEAVEILDNVIFVPNAIIYFTDWYNLFAMLWMVQFICSCQNMLVAGAVAGWYFAKDKSRLRRPIRKSGYNMIKFHLGTISFGSLIIAILQMIRVLFSLIRRSVRKLLCIDLCLSYLEGYVKYFTKNSFIMTSIHGYGFREAGSRAFRLLVQNAMEVVAVGSVGHLVLVMGKILVAALAIPIGHFMIQSKNIVEDEWILLVLIGLMAFLIAHTFMSVYEMSIDTICLCFCEDCEVNDGVTRPYYMSHELMDFIKESQAVLKKKEAQSNATPVTEVV